MHIFSEKPHVVDFVGLSTPIVVGSESLSRSGSNQNQSCGSGLKLTAYRSDPREEEKPDPDPTLRKTGSLNFLSQYPIWYTFCAIISLTFVKRYWKKNLK